MTPQAATTLAVEATGLGKQYLDHHALDPLDLAVALGERITLVGHNGSGKTTMIKLLAGTLEPSEGSASVMGHAVGSIGARAAVAYLPDQPVFYDDLSVWEHLEFTARLHSTDEWEQRAVDLLDALGLLPAPTTCRRRSAVASSRSRRSRWRSSARSSCSSSTSRSSGWIRSAERRCSNCCGMRTRMVRRCSSPPTNCRRRATATV